METKRTIEVTEASGLLLDAMRKAYESLELATEAAEKYFGAGERRSEENEALFHGLCAAYSGYTDKLSKTFWMMAKDNLSWVENGTICNRV